jgi:hypothetical protein
MDQHSDWLLMGLVGSLVIYSLLRIRKEIIFNLVESEMRYIKFSLGPYYLLYNTLRTATNLVSL